MAERYYSIGKSEGWLGAIIEDIRRSREPAVDSDWGIRELEEPERGIIARATIDGFAELNDFRLQEAEDGTLALNPNRGNWDNLNSFGRLKDAARAMIYAITGSKLEFIYTPFDASKIVDPLYQVTQDPYGGLVGQRIVSVSQLGE